MKGGKHQKKTPNSKVISCPYSRFERGAEKLRSFYKFIHLDLFRCFLLSTMGFITIKTHEAYGFHSDQNLFSTVRKKQKSSEEYSREELEETATGRNLVFEAEIMPRFFSEVSQVVVLGIYIYIHYVQVPKVLYIGACENLGSEWVAIMYSNFYEGNPFLTFTDSTGFPPVLSSRTKPIYIDKFPK